MNRREFLKGAAAVALTPGALSACGERGPVNVLVIVADDMGGDSPGCYGGPADATPHIDGLAAAGMRFDHANVVTSVCRPSRTALMTGRYPHRYGVRGAVAPGVPLLTDSLRSAGYLLGILGKVDHIRPIRRYRWDVAHDGDELGWGRNPKLYADLAAAFFEQTRREARPFFLMANAHDPHRPFANSREDRAERGGEAEPSRTFSPDEVPVPGFLPDLPPVRTELAQYFDSVRRSDDTVGALLGALGSAGFEDDTLVIFLSDNGASFPFAKTNCYRQSTRVPWIVRWPGRVAEGVVSEGLVSGIDLMPTLLDALGLPPAAVDGRSFLPALVGDAGSGRETLVTVLEQDGDGQPRPMRCLHSGRLAYIYNAWSDGRAEFHSEAERGLTLPAMVRAARHDPGVAERLRFYRFRTPEELYDFEADPNALRNLADVPGAAEDLGRLRAGLLGWMERTGDPLRPRFRAYLDGLGSGSA